MVDDQPHLPRLGAADRFGLFPVTEPVLEIRRHHGGGEHSGAVERLVLKDGAQMIRRRGIEGTERLDILQPATKGAAEAGKIRELAAGVPGIGVRRGTAPPKVRLQERVQLLPPNRIDQHGPLFTGHTIYITSLSSVCLYHTPNPRATPCHPVPPRANAAKKPPRFRARWERGMECVTRYAQSE